MRIFDDVPRDYGGPAGFAEPQFAYYNRSSRPYVHRLREQMELWFSRYPTEDQAGLRTRIRSGFSEGFLELVVFAVLRGLGYEVEVHPSVPGKSRHPDYLAIPANGMPRTYVECSVVRDSSDADMRRQLVANQILDAINTFVPDNFMFGITRIVGQPQGQPSKRRLLHLLRSWLKNLDPDDVELAAVASAYRALPRTTFVEAGLTVEIFAIPKKREARGQVRDRSLAMGPVDVAWGGGRVDSLLASLKSKATRYGDMPECYVIAVNAASRWGMDDLSVTETLFGREGPIFKPGSRDVTWVPSGEGLFVHRGRAVNTRVSAVLVLYELVPSNLADCRCRLFHQPWAARPLSGALTNFPQAIRTHDDYKSVPGVSVGSVLGLPKGWPVLDEAL